MQVARRDIGQLTDVVLLQVKAKQTLSFRPLAVTFCQELIGMKGFVDNGLSTVWPKSQSEVRGLAGRGTVKTPLG